MYNCEAVSVPAFIQQLTNLISHGYWFYVTGEVPAGKDVEKIDAKIIHKYGLELTPWQRSRKKKAGSANVAYLRFGRRWVILSTKGQHRFFESVHAPARLAGESLRDVHGQEQRIADIRERSIKFFDYAISYKEGGYLRLSDEDKAEGKKARDHKWHVRVELRREVYKDLKAHMLELSTKREASELAEVIRRRRFLGYAPVIVQLGRILKSTNTKRRRAGLAGDVPKSCIPRKVRRVQVFARKNKMAA